MPNQMWGTDATAAFTGEDGQVTVFIAVDHCTAECVGIHAAKPGTRYEALEPIRQAIRSRFGPIGLDVAQGLSGATRPREPAWVQGVVATLFYLSEHR